jgi:hypothetical protein
MRGPQTADHVAKRMEGVRRAHREGKFSYDHFRELRGETASQWKGDDISYRGAHSRIARNRGKADQYQCVDCDDQAVQWSFNRAAAEVVKVSPAGMPYSPNPADYEPRCCRCHLAVDNAELTVNCASCGKEFTTHQQTARACSRVCKLRIWRSKQSKEETR